MAAEMIASLLTLLVFLAAVIAPFAYLLFKQREERKRQPRKTAQPRRNEGELEPFDQREEDKIPRYSEGRAETSHTGGSPRFSEGGNPGRRPGKGAALGSELGGGVAEGQERLLSHIADFSSEGLNATLGERYEKWDEPGSNIGTGAGPAAARVSGIGPRSSASSKSSGWGIHSAGKSRRRIESLPELQRAVIMSEVLGPPRALKPHD